MKILGRWRRSTQWWSCPTPPRASTRDAPTGLLAFSSGLAVGNEPLASHRLLQRYTSPSPRVWIPAFAGMDELPTGVYFRTNDERGAGSVSEGAVVGGQSWSRVTFSWYQ